MGKLDSKVAIVTGAGSLGMGRATAILLAQEGAKVVVNDVVIEDGEQTVAMIKEAGGEAPPMSLSLQTCSAWSGQQ
jgi:3(or 17)beta-hydroxysteroid dehydrogenase